MVELTVFHRLPEGLVRYRWQVVPPVGAAPDRVRQGDILPPFQTRQGEILPGEIVSSGSSQRAWLARLVRPPPVHVVVGKSPPLLLVFPRILGEHEDLRALHVPVRGEPPGEGVEGAPVARGGLGEGHHRSLGIWA